MTDGTPKDSAKTALSKTKFVFYGSPDSDIKYTSTKESSANSESKRIEYAGVNLKRY